MIIFLRPNFYSFSLLSYLTFESTATVTKWPLPWINRITQKVSTDFHKIRW